LRKKQTKKKRRRNFQEFCTGVPATAADPAGMGDPVTPQIIISFFLDSNKLSTLGRNLRQLFLPTNPRRSFTLPVASNRGAYLMIMIQGYSEKESLSLSTCSSSSSS
jgi:hypothetical protein